MWWCAAQRDKRGNCLCQTPDYGGSNLGDDHKEYFSGDQAVKHLEKDNTMNQFN